MTSERGARPARPAQRSLLATLRAATPARPAERSPRATLPAATLPPTAQQPPLATLPAATRPPTAQQPLATLPGATQPPTAQRPLATLPGATQPPTAQRPPLATLPGATQPPTAQRPPLATLPAATPPPTAQRPPLATLGAAPAALVAAGVAAVHLAPAVLAAAGLAAARATPTMLGAAGRAAARATPAVLAAVARAVPAVRGAAARIAPAVLAAAGLTVSGPGCGKSDRAASTGASPPVTIDPASVNALVPAELKDRLVFERRELATARAAHQVTYALAAPRGWVQTSKHFAHLRPAGAAATVPRFEIGTSCDGSCTAKPWDEITDRVHFAPLARGKVIQDERGAGRRSMIADIERAGAPVTEVVMAWWTDGAPHYHVCTAALDPALKPAAPAFARACQAVAITGDD